MQKKSQLLGLYDACRAKYFRNILPCKDYKRKSWFILSVSMPHTYYQFKGKELKKCYGFTQVEIGHMIQQ